MVKWGLRGYKGIIMSTREHAIVEAAASWCQAPGAIQLRVGRGQYVNEVHGRDVDQEGIGALRAISGLDR